MFCNYDALPVRRLQITEENLIEEFSKGNKAALSYIYDSYSAALYGIIIKIVRNEELSQDILHDVIIKIWKKRNHYNQSKGSLYTWMLNLTRNHCIDYLRSKANRNDLQNREISNFVYSLESNRKFDPQHIGLNELLKKLPEEQQQIIQLSYFEGYTQKEISEDYNIPIGTVKSRTKAALEKLRKIFNHG